MKNQLSPEDENDGGTEVENTQIQAFTNSALSKFSYILALYHPSRLKSINIFYQITSFYFWWSIHDTAGVI
jgi:hypothetical protein